MHNCITHLYNNNNNYILPQLFYYITYIIYKFYKNNIYILIEKLKLLLYNIDFILVLLRYNLFEFY